MGAVEEGKESQVSDSSVVVEVSGSSSKPPRAEQLRRLRQLAEETGETFAYPRSEAEAEVEIARMEGRPVSGGVEKWLDRAAVRRQVSRGSRDAAAVRSSEISGYGSRSRWRHAQR